MIDAIEHEPWRTWLELDAHEELEALLAGIAAAAVGEFHGRAQAVVVTSSEVVSTSHRPVTASGIRVSSVSVSARWSTWCSARIHCASNTSMICASGGWWAARIAMVSPPTGVIWWMRAVSLVT